MGKARVYSMPQHIEEGWAVVSPAGNVMKATIRDDAETARAVGERITGYKWKKMYRDGARCRWVGIAIIPTNEERRMAAALAKRPPVKKAARKK